MRGVNLNPGADPDDMISLRLWISQHVIISTRMRHLFSVNDLKEDLQQKRGPRNTQDFVVQILFLLVSRMGETIDNFEEVLAILESQLLSGENKLLRTELATLRKQTIELRRFFTPQRDALVELMLKNPLKFNANSLRMIQETKEQLIRHIEDLDAVFGRSAITSEELLSQLSDTINKKIYILSIIAAIFLPLGFLTGLLGVNIAGIPGAEYPHAFSVFVAIMFIIVLIQIFIFKTRKWF
jgi:zinc transporter